jgi:hypothetical protein
VGIFSKNDLIEVKRRLMLAKTTSLMATQSGIFSDSVVVVSIL